MKNEEIRQATKPTRSKFTVIFYVEKNIANPVLLMEMIVFVSCFKLNKQVT